MASRPIAVVTQLTYRSVRCRRAHSSRTDVCGRAIPLLLRATSHRVQRASLSSTQRTTGRDVPCLKRCPLLLGRRLLRQQYESLDTQQEHDGKIAPPNARRATRANSAKAGDAKLRGYGARDCISALCQSSRRTALYGGLVPCELVNGPPLLSLC